MALTVARLCLDVSKEVGWRRRRRRKRRKRKEEEFILNRTHARGAIPTERCQSI